jgi:ssDNA-binding replication factor A large subunit
VAARLFADQTGSIKVDVWKDTYANYPPTDADTITAGNEPQFTSAQKYEDKLLTGWTRRFFRGDVIGFNVDSASSVTWCLVCLTAKPME